MAFAVVIVGLLGGAARAQAATRVVNFDDLAPGTTVGVQYAASAGVSFTQPTDPGYAPVVRAAADAHSGDRVADIETCDPSPCGEFPAPPNTRGELGTLASSLSAYVGYLDGAGSNTAQVELIAYDAAGSIVGQSPVQTVTQGTGFATKLEADSPSANIAYFDITDPNSNEFGAAVAFDDLTIVTPDVAQPPDFTLSPGSGVLDVLQGQSVEDSLTISRINGSSGPVTFGVSGLPTGMTGTFSPNPLTGTDTHTTLTLTAAQGAAASTDYSTATITATPSPSAGSTPRSTTTLVRISENCSKTVRFDYVDLRSDGCLRKQGSSQFVALNEDVRINGLVLHPLDGDRVLTVDPVAKTIKSDFGATYSVSVIGSPDTPFYDGPIDWSFTTDSTTPVPIAQVGTGKPKQLIGIDISGVPFFQGIPLTGISVVFTQSGKAIVTPTLKLDFWPFNYFGALTVNTSFATDNDHGAGFGGLEIKVPELDVLALKIKDVDLKYVDTGTWSGSASVVLGFADNLSVGAGFGIKNDHFDFLRGQVGGLNTAIGAGVFLQSLGFEVDTNPLMLTGQIGLSAGPAVAGKTALSFTGAVTAVLADPWIIEVDGKAKVADKYDLASAFLRYSSTGLFEFGGKVHWSLDVVYVDGSVTGWVAGLHNFDVEGAVNGCISIDFFPDPCAGAKVLVSNLGIAGCVQVFGYGVGVGSHWGDDFDAFTGCDLSPWRPAKPGAATDAAVVRRFTVPRGLPAVAWSLDGSGGVPPDVAVTGPGHAALSLSRAAPYVRNSRFLAAETANGRTYVVVNHPAAGTWSIAGTGAVPITQIRQAVGLPQPSVHATVAGNGRRRVLSFRLKPIAGQVVQFAEIGKDVRRVITSTTRARGRVRFTPALGPAGRREIEAIVEQDGRPRKTLTVAAYRAPGMPKPERVHKLKLVRGNSAITVSWKPDRFRHAVYLALGDGRRLLRFVAANRHSASVAGVPQTVAVTANVIGLTAGGSKGPLAAASAKATVGPIVPGGKRPRIGALLKTGFAQLRFNAPGPGTLTIAWYSRPARGQPKATLVAIGALNLSAPGTATIRIGLTDAGRKLLRHVKSLPLTARGTFKPVGRAAIIATKRFTISR